MNGKPEKSVHIVDKKAEKTAKINKRVTKQVYGKNNAAVMQNEWDFIPRFYVDGLKLIGRVLYIPVVLAAAVLEGVRCGFISGLQKALAMYR